MHETATVMNNTSRLAETSDSGQRNLPLYFVLFFLSGFPALLYQIVWQRELFTAYGVNIESVTVIVTVFMLGLGLGSLAGGKLSARQGTGLLRAFGTIELCIGVFGIASLWIFKRVATLTAGASLFETGILTFALLLIPTLLMGSTLPLLVEHFVRLSQNLGDSLGLLYAVNTFGSGVACIAAALFLMRTLGETGSVRLAACFNISVGITAIIFQGSSNATTPQQRWKPEKLEQLETVPLWLGMFLAGACGFAALAYEIIWYRLYSFTSGGTAPCFALLLAFYLFGIAYGSMAVHDECRKKLRNNLSSTLAAASLVVFLGSISAFLLGPGLAHWVVHFSYPPTFALVFTSAGLLGAAFPLLSHATVNHTKKAGKSVGLLYLSNILGSTLGSFLVGFIVLDHWSTRTTSIALLWLGFLISLTLGILSKQPRRKAILTTEFAVCLVLVLCSSFLFSRMYERLLRKSSFSPDMTFSDLVENRSGVIAVYRTQVHGRLDDVVYGGGAYDGAFNTDVIHDANGLFRAYALWGMKPAPKHVLMIGLSSGSWAQVIANNPQVDDFTIVEINPGYLPLIRKRAEVASLLQNPKVHIVIDDGRRWLVGHPDRRFDLIVMNTTFNWRANASNLLSTEFLNLIRSHLIYGGIAYYNTTWSDRVLATGVAAFPYALRFSNFLAVSEQPFSIDKNRWRTALSSAHIQGRPAFDIADPAQRAKLEQLLHWADMIDDPKGNIESRASLANRLKGIHVITDNNMGTEWQ